MYGVRGVEECDTWMSEQQGEGEIVSSEGERKFSRSIGG